jgi:hypothetical protein
MLVPTSFSMVRRRILQGSVAFLGMLAVQPLIAANLAAPIARLKRHASRSLAHPADERLTSSVAASTNTFTEGEQAIITRLVETMLPSDATPGARETGSAVFVIGSLQQRNASVFASIQQGLAAVDGISLQQFGQGFAIISDVQAEQIMGLVATHPQLAPLWSAVRSLAVFHFYAQPIAYEPLGMPGPNIDKGGFPDGQSNYCN